MDESDHRGDNAKSEPRDAEGHFVHVEPAKGGEHLEPVKAGEHPEPAERTLVDELIPHTVSIDHKADDNTLLDVHLGNPLRRIQALLEDIKKQKAFSFTLKGSLGIAGIALVITTFGIFGGTQAFCSKGTQSEIGSLKMLNITDSIAPSIPFIPDSVISIWDTLTGKSISTTQRLVLIKQDQTVLHIIKSSSVSLSPALFASLVIATGDYDSCSQTLSIRDSQSIQSY